MKLPLCLFQFIIPLVCFSQQEYNGPYLEALVKYKFRIGEEAKNPGWGMGFRMDTAQRRYMQIANDGFLTRSEFQYDEEGKPSKEISLQLATGIRHIYAFTYQWLGPDTLQSLRSDYTLTTNYIYKNKQLQYVENIHYGSICKLINEKPAGIDAAIPANTTCFERVAFIRDTTGIVTAKRYTYHYSQFNAIPVHEYLEEYHKNAKGQVDTVWIFDEGKKIVMAFEYTKKNKIKKASRRHIGFARYEIWDFKYKCNGLLKKVTYHDFPGKIWQDKYRWKCHHWKKPYPAIPNLDKFISSSELKLGKDFYFGY